LPAHRTESALSRKQLNVVIEYIDAHLDTDLTLAALARAVHTSAYHFARQFNAATGLSPHQYVVTRRVERAQQLLRERDDLPLSEVARSVGFSDQSQLSTHFKRIVVITPKQFRKSARIAENSARFSKIPDCCAAYAFLITARGVGVAATVTSVDGAGPMASPTAPTEREVR
jgi:AraC-like DNA-binding protein